MELGHDPHEDAEHALRLIVTVLADGAPASLLYGPNACLAIGADALGVDAPFDPPLYFQK